MGCPDAQLCNEGLTAIVLISGDIEFADRFRALARKTTEVSRVVKVFDDLLAALVHMLEHSPHVVVYDLDFDSPERNLEALRAIRLICRHAPIILGASQHCAVPFDHAEQVGIFYRIVKSAPDGELESAVESAQRSFRK